ncbi:DNA-binding NarL/FixJ family response regulator [Kribbella sp. VKM Ac-2527]|uniref:DNA-binding NarL/FixJ family response regulator n=1 Tax=Kribbella caucasensis TaxID=2512215 RepID=A0A4R6JGT0_9ACTN|nr:DNA-binding NarL/FixJ family response regulator [Kribbella sp. VKM Ac-2527]
MHSVTGPSIVVCDPHRTVGEAVAVGLARLAGASVLTVETHFVEALHTVATRQPDAIVVEPDLLGRPLGTVVAAFVNASSRSGLVVITADTNTLPARLDRMIRLVSDDYTMDGLIAAVRAAVTAGHTGGRQASGVFDQLDGGVASRLTARERQVLECLAEGCDPAAIARRLSITTSTARTHVKNLCHRLGVHSAAEAVTLIRHS